METNLEEVDILLGTERYLDFKRRIESNQEIEAGPYTHAFHVAFAEALADEYSAFPSVIYDFINGRGHKQMPRNLAMKNVKAVQAVFVERYERSHSHGIWTPQGLDTPAAWHERAIHKISDDEGFRDQYESYLMLPNTANVPSRSVIYGATLALMGVTEPVSILDIGSSTNKNLKRLALTANSSDHAPTLEVVNPISHTADPLMSRRLQQLIKDRPVRLKPSLGIDIFNWQAKPQLLSYARSNAFYLEELFDSELVSEYDELSASNPKNVGYMVLDATVDYSDKTALEHKAITDPELEESFDVVYLSTMLYQLSRQDKIQVLKNAQAWAKPDGMIVVQDFIELDDNRLRTHPQERWKWKYNVWVKDLKDERPEFRKLLVVESGRARRLMFQPMVGDLAVAREYGLLA